MKQKYSQPQMKVVAIAPQPIICTGSSGWAQMSGYRSNTGSGFTQ